MKYLVIFLFTAAAYAQPDVNVLSEFEFENIQINGHTISQIRTANGEKVQMQNLYGTALEYNAYNSGKSKAFNYGNFTIGFSSSSSGSNTTELSNFKITGPSVTIRIDNIQFSVNDNISVLSPLNLAENNGGNYIPGIKGYIIAPCEKCNHFVYIKFSELNQSILEIGYIELT